MVVEITRTFYPKTTTAWREWLIKHHAHKKEIWVVFYKKHTGKHTLAYEDAVREALCFGWIDGIEKRMDEERYALRFTPRSVKSAWSETNVNRYKLLVTQGKMTEAGRQAFERKVHIYPAKGNKRGAIEWHLSHKMPKNPTLNDRIAWHKEHAMICGCRPVPKSLLPYLKS